MNVIDYVIRKVFAIIFMILLIAMQVVLVIAFTLLECIAYPVEFLSNFVLEAKDVCRQVLDDED